MPQNNSPRKKIRKMVRFSLAGLRGELTGQVLTTTIDNKLVVKIKLDSGYDYFNIEPSRVTEKWEE